MRSTILKSGVIGLSIVAMMLQLVVSSAHIHRLDGDKYHQVHASQKSSERASEQLRNGRDWEQGDAQVRELAQHQPRDHQGHRDHSDHRYDLAAHGGETSQNKQPDDEHAPWHACDFCLLFGVFAALDISSATGFIPPSFAKDQRAPEERHQYVAGIKWRANGARAPPSIT